MIPNMSVTPSAASIFAITCPPVSPLAMTPPVSLVIKPRGSVGHAEGFVANALTVQARSELVVARLCGTTLDTKAAASLA